MISVTFTCAQKSVTRWADDGHTVSYSCGAGIVLKKVSGATTSVVTEGSPFVHAGAPAAYFLECISSDGSPVVGTLSIEGA